jgi:hypothetical protein
MPKNGRRRRSIRARCLRDWGISVSWVSYPEEYGGGAEFCYDCFCEEISRCGALGFALSVWRQKLRLLVEYGTHDQK